jgi:hypothetical protein
MDIESELANFENALRAKERDTYELAIAGD